MKMKSHYIIEWDVNLDEDPPRPYAAVYFGPILSDQKGRKSVWLLNLERELTVFTKTASNLINKQDVSFSGKFFQISDISRFLCFVVTKPGPVQHTHGHLSSSEESAGREKKTHRTGQFLDVQCCYWPSAALRLIQTESISSRFCLISP